MILVRIARGITDHFPSRATEWHMCLPALYVGLALNWQPDLFSTSPAYHAVAGWMGESMWSWLFLSCAMLRFMALTINGTFQVFRWSPLIRLVVAALTAVAWGQFSLGFFMQWTATGSPTFLMGLSTHLVLVEFFNVFRASRDIAEAEHARLAKG